MSEKIVDGYIIKVIDYNVFDAVVSILTVQDTILACFAQGVKKLLSKNARHLIIGNYNETIIFPASQERLSRLKKTICLDPINLEYHQWTTFSILTNFSSKLSGYVPGFFSLYNEIMQAMKTQQYSDEYLSLYLVVQLIKYLGINFTHHCCAWCGSTENMLTIDFNKSGFVCKQCYLDNPEKMFLFNTYDLKELHYMWHHDQPRKANIYQKKSLAFLLKGLLTIIDKYAGINITQSVTANNWKNKN